MNGLGKVAFLEGKNIDDNPYKKDEHIDVLQKEWWERGWDITRESMEGTSSFFSAKKEKEEKGELQEREIAALHKKIANAHSADREWQKANRELSKLIFRLFEDMRTTIKRTYWRVSSLRKAMSSLEEWHRKEYRKIVGYFPDK